MSVSLSHMVTCGGTRCVGVIVGDTGHGTIPGALHMPSVAFVLWVCLGGSSCGSDSVLPANSASPPDMRFRSLSYWTPYFENYSLWCSGLLRSAWGTLLL